MSFSVYYFFELILIICFNRVINAIKESFELTQTLTQKRLNFFLGNRNINLVFYFILLLLQLE